MDLPCGVLQISLVEPEHVEADQVEADQAVVQIKPRT